MNSSRPALRVRSALALIVVLGSLGCLSFAQNAEERAGIAFKEWLSRLVNEAHTSEQKQAADNIAKLLKDGQISKASLALKDMSSKSANPTAAIELGAMLSEASPAEVAQWQSHTQGLASVIESAQLDDQELAVFRTLEEVSGRVPSVKLVPIHVNSFMSKYAYGAAHSREILANYPAQYREVLEPYLNLPREQRVFVIGARADGGLVERYGAEEQHHGRAVFFYSFCAGAGRGLCDPDLVGALMKEAGQIVVIDTPAARMSPYVYVEAAAANQLRSGQALVTLIPVPEFILAIGSMTPQAAATLMQGTAKVIAVDVSVQQQ